MKFQSLATLALAALASALIHLAAHAAPLARTATLPPVEGEVIVGFKPEADTLRKHALSARAAPTDVKQVLARRTEGLSQRLGRTLQAGDAIGEREMVMRASGVDATTLARQLAADPEIAYAVPNGRKRIVAAPNDPLYPPTAAGVRPSGPDSGQWYLRTPDSTIRSAINTEGAWARTTGAGSVVVAVLDTGVRFDHPDLTRKLLRGYDFVADPAVGNDGDGRDADPSDPGDWVTADDKTGATFRNCDVSGSSWHGTSTASLVGAAANTTPALGMAGSAPGVLVLPVRVLGKCFGSDSDIIAGMRWSAGISIPGVPDNPTPAKVLNMSLGGDGACKASYQTAVNEIVARGVTIVAAAGNSAGGPVSEPANCVGVIGVLALRHAGTKVGFSDLGSEITIAAPGGNCINITAGSRCLYPILAATNLGSQGPTSASWTDSFDISVGTSFSSPLVAGVAALMISRQPTLTPAALRSAMQSSARPFPTSGAETPGETIPVCRAPSSGVEQLQCYCTTGLCGAGMIDASAAVAAVSGTAPFVNVTVEPPAPLTGEALSFRITGLQTRSGSAVASYQWTLVDGGGAAAGFSSADNAATAALTPTAAGTLKVRLTLTDAAGGTSTADQTVTVYSAPVPPSGGGSSDSGGGAASGAWVAGVGLAAAVLALLNAWGSGLFRVGRRRA